MSEPTIPQKPPFEETEAYTDEHVRVLVYVATFQHPKLGIAEFTGVYGSLENAMDACQRMYAGAFAGVLGDKPLNFVRMERGWFALHPQHNHPETGYGIITRIVENAKIIRKLDV